MREIVLSDVIDADELATRMRREGMYFGVINFVERLSLVVVSGGSALVLYAGSFAAGASSQSPRAVMALRIGIPGLALAALLVFLVAMRFYPLGSEQVRAMHGELEKRHAGHGTDGVARGGAHREAHRPAGGSGSSARR